MARCGDRELTKAQCTKLLRRALRSERASVLAFELRSLGENLGFMGEHMRLSVRYQLEGSLQERSFFLKRTPSSERHSRYVVGAGLFCKEREMYETLLPLMCRHLGLDRLPTPECYYVSEGHFLVLEDLATAGFVLRDKLLPLDVEFCRVAVQAIAKFHAGSIAVEARTGQCISTFTQHKSEVLLVGEHEPSSLAHAWHKASQRTMLGFLQKMNVYRDRLEADWQSVHTRLRNAWNKSSDFARTPSSKFRNVLCHGDLWLNNVLFRCDEAGHASEAALVDFQIYRHVPPAMDLVMFLHTTTSRRLREEHLTDLLIAYHRQLTRTLAAAGLEEHALSLDELRQSVHEYRLFGVVVAARYMPTCLKSSDEIEDVKHRLAGHSDNNLPEEFLQDSSDLLVRSLERCPARRTRVLEAVDELLEWLDL